MEFIKVQSSTVDAIAFEPTRRELWVRFHGKETMYVYPGFSAESFEELKSANSKGQWMRNYLRAQGVDKIAKPKKESAPPNCDFAIL